MKCLKNVRSLSGLPRDEVSVGVCLLLGSYDRAV